SSDRSSTAPAPAAANPSPPRPSRTREGRTLSPASLPPSSPWPAPQPDHRKHRKPARTKPPPDTGPGRTARHAALRHARRKGTTRSNQKQELPTTGQTPKAHGIEAWVALPNNATSCLRPSAWTPAADHPSRRTYLVNALGSTLLRHAIKPFAGDAHTPQYCPGNGHRNSRMARCRSPDGEPDTWCSRILRASVTRSCSRPERRRR